jgi:amidohydrolase
MRARQAAQRVLAGLGAALPGLTELYVDLHAHPELSLHETRTAGMVASYLAARGYDVHTGIGGTGVVGVLARGAGPVVMLRADMDALPVLEQTGLEYASTRTAADEDGSTVPVMHACGHDMHVACLLGAAALLAEGRDCWAGTVVVLFQPAEEIGVGARAMVDDGLFDRVPRPDIVLGQHVDETPAGRLEYRAGPVLAAADSLRVRFFGRGGHASAPELAVDPVVMSCHAVVRLQSVVSREVAARDRVVITVGSIVAGTRDNIIPDFADVLVDVRTFSPEVRNAVLAAVRRVVRHEAAASGAPREPEVELVSRCPATVNDVAATEQVVAAFADWFGSEALREIEPVMGSEDFGHLGEAAGCPAVYWGFGGGDPEAYARAEDEGRIAELPINHSPQFAPVVAPTLGTGVAALVVASMAWLGVEHPVAGPAAQDASGR